MAGRVVRLDSLAVALPTNVPDWLSVQRGEMVK